MVIHWFVGDEFEFGQLISLANLIKALFGRAHVDHGIVPHLLAEKCANFGVHGRLKGKTVAQCSKHLCQRHEGDKRKAGVSGKRPEGTRFV